MFRLPAAALTLAVVAAGGSVAARADAIPYPNPFHVAPTQLITASSTGNVYGYFTGANAVYTDTIRMRDVTSGTLSDWFFNNQITPLGTSANFGFVTAGDTLVFELFDANQNEIFASDPAYSAEGVNHAYATAYSGGTVNGMTIPTGTYLGMEDLDAHNSDLDYNDDTFVFTNIAPSIPTPPPSTSPVPEPSSIALMGTGLLAAAGTLRRRLKRS